MFTTLVKGDSAELQYTVTAEMIDAYAAVSGDDNALHMDREHARKRGFKDRVAHAQILFSHLSTLIGTKMPGEGALWTGQNLDFLAPIYPGDTVKLTATVRHLSQSTRTIVLDVTATNVESGAQLARGKGKVHLPEQTQAPEKTKEVSDMTILVTGGSRGLGRAVALELGKLGATVMVHFHSNADAANEVIAAVKDSGGDADAVQADLSSSEGIEAFAALLSDRDVDGVVHCATPKIERVPWESSGPEALDTHLMVNVRAADAIARALYPRMKDRRFGRMVFVLSSAAWGRPPPNMVPYVTAKHALRGLVCGLASELGPHGICVNAVSPGLLETDNSENLSAMAKKMEAAQSPLKRLAALEEVAGAIIGLLGPTGSYVNGADLPVTGGTVM